MSKKDKIISQMRDGMMLSCDTATLLITKGEYTNLSIVEGFQLKLHLMTCNLCKLFQEQSKEISLKIDEFSDINNENPIHKLSEEQKKRLHQSIDNQ